VDEEEEGEEEEGNARSDRSGVHRRRVGCARCVVLGDSDRKPFLKPSTPPDPGSRFVG
jgi:hypothetical protein